MDPTEYLVDLPCPPTVPKRYESNPAHTSKLLGVGGLLLVVGLVTGWFWLQGELQGRLAIAPFLLIPAGSVMVGLEVWNLIRPLRVTLTHAGFAVNGEQYPWARVTAVGEQYNPDSRLNGLTIWVRVGARSVRLSTARIEDLPELLAAIHHHTLSRLTSTARAAVRAGEVVTFGPIELASTGLRVKGRVIHWHELDGVWPDDSGDVGVWAGGKKLLDVPTGKVDNLRVLLQLVDEYRAEPAHSRGMVG